MRPTPDQYFLRMAALAATRGTCFRRQVGCVLVNARGHVLATGYNGVAAGMPHCNEAEPSEQDAVGVLSLSYPHACPGAQAPSGTQLDACGAIHAEQNALLQCRDVYEIQTCYVTHSPCVPCTKLLMNTGCLSIVFIEPYAHDAPARELWTQSAPKVSGFVATRTWRRASC